MEIAGERSSQHLYVYLDDEAVRGKVVVNLGKGVKEVEHQGIRVDFIGQIGTSFNDSLHLRIPPISREQIVLHEFYCTLTSI